MRPIVLATDYGVSGSYVGQLKSAIYKIAPNALIIDLIHDLPAFNTKASAYLLASYLKYIPENSIVIGVVDPGVGSNRKSIVLEGDGFTFIGPNNGLFAITSRKLSSFKISEIVLDEKPISNTFHGRDIFAPVAAQISLELATNLKPISIDKFIGTDWHDQLSEVIYFDHYGNAITGISQGNLNMDQLIVVNGAQVKYAETFCTVEPSEYLWYFNSNGLVEIAAREASAKDRLKLLVGTTVAF